METRWFDVNSFIPKNDLKIYIEVEKGMDETAVTSTSYIDGCNGIRALPGFVAKGEQLTAKVASEEV